MRKLLCQNQLQIWLDDDQIQLKLGNALELNYPVSTNTLNRRYHIREALVIGMRLLIAQAVQTGLIDLSSLPSRGLSSTSSRSSRETRQSGVAIALLIDLDVS